MITEEPPPPERQHTDVCQSLQDSVRRNTARLVHPGLQRPKIIQAALEVRSRAAGADTSGFLTGCVVATDRRCLQDQNTRTVIKSETERRLCRKTCRAKGDKQVGETELKLASSVHLQLSFRPSGSLNFPGMKAKENQPAKNQLSAPAANHERSFFHKQDNRNVHS